MFKKPFFPWLTGIACAFIAGCGGVSLSLAFFDFPEDRVQTLSFQEVTPIVSSAIEDRRLVVVRDLIAWDTLWREHAAGISPPPPMPPINFSQNMVIGIFLGRYVNACRDVGIESISQHIHPDRIEVNFRDIPAPLNPGCPLGSSNPAKLLVLPYSILPVEFFQVS
ncbi:MAG TPA: hypothetical protein DHV59_11175 [Oxalobacteraceae bacterium]|nr:hypothetical protein [Oxalobacteraceae bacterium]